MIYILDGKYEKTIYPECPDIDIKKILTHIVQNPSHDRNKDSIKLFHDVEVVDKPSKDIRGRIRKLGENISKLCSIILDYDDGIFTMDDARDQFKDFWHVAYSSFNSTAESPRFRVVLPLKYPISAPWLRSVRQTVLGHYPHVDQSTLHIGRFFYLPSIRKGVKNYEYYIHEGKPYKIPGRYALTNSQERKILDIKIPCKQSDDNPISKKLMEIKKKRIFLEAHKILDDLPFFNRGYGVVHDSLLRLNARLYHEGITTSDILELFFEYAPDYKTQEEMRQIVTKYKPVYRDIGGGA
jgi:hypothetical protein